MSILKYRVWVDGFKEPFYAPTESFSLVITDTGHRLQMWCSDGLVDEFPVNQVDQFIGLQDINGVDIYNGDDVSRANGQVWIVEYSDNEAAFVVYNQLNSNRRLQSSFGDHYSIDDGNVMNMAAVFSIASNEESPCEVTGNRHQNPELLQ
jgi:uncharacterized phage protein (TIGR01671 family)